MNAFAREIELVNELATSALCGQVVDVTGMTITVSGLPAPIGAVCNVCRHDGSIVEAQVVGFKDDRTIAMPLDEPLGVARGNEVIAWPGTARVGVCDELVGRVLDGMGRVIDDGPKLHFTEHYPVYRAAPHALDRPRIETPLSTGIRALDGLLTCGRGQRLGLFSGTGVGKSVLLGMISRYTDADVTVLALVGERGREVNDFLENDLGEEGRSKTVMVLSTSDESPVLRVRAGFTATAVAEYFRDRGKNVLLLMDSLTRIAMAQRQIGLAAGEPPTTKGYTPSAFGMLPQLLERAGQTQSGSITGFYTVLVEADDINDPIGDAVRGILDGHVWLSRALANKSHYPAISVSESISRVMSSIVDDQHLSAARLIGKLVATWNEIEDLVNIGAYVPGSNPEFDTVIQTRESVLGFLQQSISERSTIAQTRKRLVALGQEIRELQARLTQEKAGRRVPAAADGS